MKHREVLIQHEAFEDLVSGRAFYETQGAGLGGYFFDSLIADIESLVFYAGIHSCHFGFHRMLSKRFPFAIYYEINNHIVIVSAVLDMRRNPALNRGTLESRRHD